MSWGTSVSKSLIASARRAQFSTCFLSTFYMAASALGAGDPRMNGTQRLPGGTSQRKGRDFIRV